jgi:Rieske 2Fe-2S family protein
MERLLPFWQRTSEQDWAICEAQQSGVASPAYKPGPYSRMREANVQHFIDWYLAALAMPEPVKQRPKLRSLGYKDRPGV